MNEMAIIGFAGCYGGAENEEEFWRKIINKQEFFEKGVPQNDSNYVNVYSAIKDIELFDEEFFGMSPHEVKYTDPQQRLFLETCYRVLENTGYVDKKVKKRVGVFASSSFNSYFIKNVLNKSKCNAEGIDYGLLIGNDKDFLATRVAYKLNLIGPALTIQCACSSSMVGLNYACLSVERGECDAALVGGVSISIPQNEGYTTREEDNFSKDGVCRPFDERANGLVKGNGCSVIMIKKLTKAVEDKDTIYGVIENIYVNNDGAEKISFTAPSASSQKEVLKSCAISDIDYIEAHGTGTKLGDPIEMRAISQVYKDEEKIIPIGSVKANVGHLDVAAGITSIVKVLYMLSNNIIPANIHLSELNSNLRKYERDFCFPTENSSKILKKIAISSFGIGGTNAHVIIKKEQSDCKKRKKLPLYFIPISYRKEEDFINVANVLIKMLEEKNEFDDVVFSLGRRSSEFMNRRCYIVEDKNDLLRQLKNDLRLHGGNNNDKFVCIKFLSCDVKYLLDTFFENELEDDYENKWDEFLLGICSETEDIGNLYTIENGENMFCSKDAINKFYELMEYLYKERKMAINFDFLYKNTGWKQIKTYNYPLNKKKFWVDVKKQNESVSTNQITKINLVDVDIEKIVLDTIKNVLEVTQISLDDDFYELGGDSLLAIDVLDELKKRGVDCKLQELLESRTIGEFVDSFTCREMKGGDERDSSSRYKEILKNNKITERVVISKTNKQNILLIGATGFLGIHLLRELVDKPFVNKIYCLNRGKDVEEASKKLQKKLEYYFDDMLASRIKEKLTVICGDVVKEGLGIVKDGLVKLSDEVDVVINSSGIVKHYGRYEEFYNANVKAVCNLLEFSKYSNSEYIHMSTLAISGNNGMGTDINFENKIEFTEKDFDIGQPLDNPYVKSKYEAEKIVLNAIEQGIKAKIFRIGNLTNRKNDGVFQINFETDAFTQRMLLLLNFKMFPVSLLDYEFEFTPVDEAAKAIVSILEYRNEISNVFHINNDPILGNDLCSKLKEIGFPIKLHKDFEFVEQLHKESSKRKNPFMKEIIVNDINKSQFTYKSCFAYKNDFSKWYLEQLGFSWEKTDGDYLSKYIKYYIDKNVINKED